MTRTPRVAPRPRSPVLHPAPTPRAWPDAADRLEVVESGALVRMGRGAPAVLAAPGSVTAARLVPSGTRIGRRRLRSDGPVLLLEVRDGRPIALPLRDWLPGSLGFGALPEGARLAESLDLAGVRAVLSALGVEQAWSFELDELRPEHERRLERGPRPIVVGGARVDERYALLATATGVLFAVTYVVTAVLRETTGATLPARIQNVAGLLALAAVFAVGVGLLVRARRRAAAALPDVVTSTGALPGGLEVAVDPAGDLVIADPFGLQTVLPGPGRGGVRHVVAHVQQDAGVRRLQLYAANADGEPGDLPLLEMLDSWWTGDAAAGQRVLDVLEGAGLARHEVRVPRGAPRSRPLDGRLLPDHRWPPGVLRGLTPSAILVLGLGVLLHDDGGPFAPVALALAIAVPAVCAAVWLARFADRRR